MIHYNSNEYYDNPADYGAGARAKPPLATQLLRSEQKHQTGSSSRQKKQSELQQSPTHSQELINASLCKLSDGLSSFQRCLGELHRHIDTIRTSIDSSMLVLMRPTYTTPSAAPEPEPSDPSEEEEEEEGDEEEEEEDDDDDEEEEEEEEQQLKSLLCSEPKPSLKEGEERLLKSPARSDPKSSSLELKSPPRLEQKPSRSERKSPSSEVEILCETMNSHGLRKYMIRRLSCLKTLQQKVPKALKLSPNPARLILEAMVMFYTQESNAYVEGSPLITERRALVLLLECFLKIKGEGEGEGGVVEIENGVKEEAEQAALAWYRRLNFEGGILKAQENDARGLLLFIGCFGIPQAFRNEDIKDLLNQSYIKMVSGSLRRSRVLMARIPEIIEEMLKQNMVVDAVYFAFCFRLEGRFDPHKLLTIYLRESEVSLLNKIQKAEQMKGSLDSVNPDIIIGAKRKYLGTLKSVIQCLGRSNIDHSKFLSEWQIGTKVISLEKEIAQLRKKLKGDQRMVQKRKIDETECLNYKEVKRSHFPNPCPPQQHRVVNHVDRKDTLLEGGGTDAHIYGHSVYPSVFHGPVAGSINENVVGSLAGSVGSVAVAGPGVGISAGTDVDLSRVGGSHGDATVYDRLPSHRYAYRPSSYLEGPNTITGDAYSRPRPYMENSMGLPNTELGGVNRPPPYSQGSAGLPNTITGYPSLHVGGSMGLTNTIPPPYQLAATGPATELYRSSGSRAVDAVPSGALAHPSSSLYWQR